MKSGDKELNGRQLQKLQTQRKLLQAARTLTMAGQVPTIAQVAKQAGVSVATAYRYYSDPQRLISDATLDAQMDGGDPDFVGVFENEARGISDPLARLLIAQKQMMANMLDHEAAYRMFIAKGYEEIVRSGLEPSKVRAGGRRILVIEAALKELKPILTKTAWTEMVQELMIVVGPEPYLVLKDFTDLPNDQILMRMNAAITAVFEAHRPKQSE